MSFQDKRKEIRNTSNNVTNYYLDTVDPYFHGKLFELVIEESLKDGNSLGDIAELLENNEINTHEIKKIFYGDDVNEKFEDNYEYRDFLTKSLSKSDFNKKEKIISNKLIEYSKIINSLTLKNSGENYSKLVNVLSSIEIVFGSDLKEKVFKRAIDELKIRTISEASDKEPIIKNVIAGKEIALTVKDMNILFPSYFKILESEVCDVPIYSKSETNGDILLDPMYSLLRMIIMTGYQNTDINTINDNKFYVTKNNSLGENEAANLTFKEIEASLESIKQSYFSGKLTKNENNEKILNKFTKALLNTFKVKQMIFNVKKISNAEEVTELEVDSKYVLIRLYNDLIEKAEQQYGTTVFSSREANRQKNKREILGNEIVLEILNENPKFIEEIENFSNNLNKSMIEINNRLKNLDAVTNIPMIYREDEKVNLIDTERDMTKRYFHSIISNEITNLMSSPGQGKSRTIKSLTEALGYRLYIIEPTSDRETVTSYAVDNNVPTINRDKLASKLSIIATSYLSGEKYNIIFFDELAKIAVELSSMNMGQKLNNLFQAALNPSIDSIEIPNPLNNNEQIRIKLTGTRIIGASNYSISQNENIDSSFRSRIVDVDMDSTNCENKGYISGIMNDNILTLLDTAFDKVNTKNMDDLFLKMNDNRDFLTTYKKIKDDKKYKKLIDGIKSVQDYNITTKSFDDLYEEVKKFDLVNPFIDMELIKDKKSKKLDAKENNNEWDVIKEIFFGIKLDSIVDDIKLKRELINKRNASLKNGEDEIEVANRYIEEYHQEFKHKKIIKYLDLNKKDEEEFNKKIMKNRSIKEYADIIYDLITENKSVSYSKFFLDVEEDKNEDLTKSKIKLILNDLQTNNSNLKLQLLKSNRFVNEVKSKMDKRDFEKVSFARRQVTDVLDALQINNISLILPLSNYSNDIVQRILKKQNFEFNQRLIPMEFTYKKTKYKSPRFYPFKADFGVVPGSDEQSLMEIKDNPVVSMFDTTDILSSCIAKVNTFIRKEIQRKDSNGKMEEGYESDDTITSINKILYREMNSIIKELVSKKSNVLEGFDILPFFDKSIKNLKPRYPDIESVIKKIIAEEINSNKIQAMNGAVFTKSSVFERTM